jgi:hypothetical protein
LKKTLGFLFGLAWLLLTADASADFHAVVEQDGTVAYCVSNGSILFGDTCEGRGRLSIVQPVTEGPVVLKSAVGTVKLENGSPQNSECAQSKAHWSIAKENSVQTKAHVKGADRADLLRRLKTFLLKDLDALESDITTAFEVDLDGDGNNEIIFISSNLDRVADKHEPNSKAVPYFVFAGVQDSTSIYPPQLFYSDRGEYAGGTDTIADVKVKGLVSIAPDTKEIALLVKTSPALIGSQMIVRLKRHTLQKLDTIEFLCN